MGQLNQLWRSRAILAPSLKDQPLQALAMADSGIRRQSVDLEQKWTDNIETSEMECYRKSTKIP